MGIGSKRNMSDKPGMSTTAINKTTDDPTPMFMYLLENNLIAKTDFFSDLRLKTLNNCENAIMTKTPALACSTLLSM